MKCCADDNDFVVLVLFEFSGISGQGKSLYDGMCSENYLLNLEDFHSIEKPKVTDLQMESLLLDATHVAAFAPLAAMFFPAAALLDAAHDRGSAQPGPSPVVLPPPPPGFVLGGNGLCLGRCPGCFQSSGWNMDAMMECCDILMGALMIAAMLFAVKAGSVPGSETDLPKELSEPGSRQTCTMSLEEARCGGIPTLLGLGMPLFCSKQSSALWVLRMKFLERLIVHAFWAKMGTTLMLWGIGC